jgi:hypothetical protein
MGVRGDKKQSAQINLKVPFFLALAVRSVGFRTIVSVAPCERALKPSSKTVILIEK